MIRIRGDYCVFDTKNTTLLLKRNGDRMEYVYYGVRLADITGAELMAGERDFFGNAFSLDLFTEQGKTDFREPSLLVRFADGSTATDFRLTALRIVKKPELVGLPSAYGEEKCLKMEFTDLPSKLRYAIYYTAYPEADAITAFAVLHNGGKKSVKLLSIASLQLELWGTDYSFTTFDGAWGCERQRHTRPLDLGKCVNQSFTGSSSPFHNPFVMLSNGEGAYGFNLVYSGNHRESAEADDFGKTRITVGMGGVGFEWELAAGEDFYAPEAVMVYAPQQEEITRRMHRFVNRHIVRGRWTKKERPVLVNNWEATYFRFDREKILAIARNAAEVGAELFVLDDGWFGKRDHDGCSLGDWFDYAEKTGGIEGLADEIRGMGLKFGIWIEPEMISEDSELYRKHPEYAMKIPKREPTRMRNQLMLNLADPQVQGFVYRAVSRVINQTKAAYVKWDYNRHMTDMFDKNSHGGEYAHRYMLGLYSILFKLVERFPNVLFESCASGGGRYDLGMLCFMPQTWVSDNTDARERIAIQSGTAFAYPQSTMGNHVSASPNEQTGNSALLETRFRVACGGVLGYELDLGTLSEEEFAQVKEQIAFYKTDRMLFQYGEYCRLGDINGAWSGFVIHAPDKSRAVFTAVAFSRRIGRNNLRIRLSGFEEGAVYRVWVRGIAGGFAEKGVIRGELLNKGNFSAEELFSQTDPKKCSNPLYSMMLLFERVNVKTGASAKKA